MSHSQFMQDIKDMKQIIDGIIKPLQQFFVPQQDSSNFGFIEDALILQQYLLQALQFDSALLFENRQLNSFWNNLKISIQIPHSLDAIKKRFFSELKYITVENLIDISDFIKENIKTPPNNYAETEHKVRNCKLHFKQVVDENVTSFVGIEIATPKPLIQFDLLPLSIQDSPSETKNKQATTSNDLQLQPLIQKQPATKSIQNDNNDNDAEKQAEALVKKKRKKNTELMSLTRTINTPFNEEDSQKLLEKPRVLRNKVQPQITSAQKMQIELSEKMKKKNVLTIEDDDDEIPPPLPLPPVIEKRKKQDHQLSISKLPDIPQRPKRPYKRRRQPSTQSESSEEELSQKQGEQQQKIQKSKEEIQLPQKEPRKKVNRENQDTRDSQNNELKGRHSIASSQGIQTENEQQITIKSTVQTQTNIKLTQNIGIQTQNQSTNNNDSYQTVLFNQSVNSTPPPQQNNEFNQNYSSNPNIQNLLNLANNPSLARFNNPLMKLQQNLGFGFMQQHHNANDPQQMAQSFAWELQQLSDSRLSKLEQQIANQTKALTSIVQTFQLMLHQQ